LRVLSVHANPDKDRHGTKNSYAVRNDQRWIPFDQSVHQPTGHRNESKSEAQQRNIVSTPRQKYFVGLSVKDQLSYNANYHHIVLIANFKFRLFHLLILVNIGFVSRGLQIGDESDLQSFMLQATKPQRVLPRKLGPKKENLG
jgi:hypothetical protein